MRTPSLGIMSSPKLNTLFIRVWGIHHDSPTLTLLYLSYVKSNCEPERNEYELSMHLRRSSVVQDYGTIHHKKEHSGQSHQANHQHRGMSLLTSLISPWLGLPLTKRESDFKRNECELTVNMRRLSVLRESGMTLIKEYLGRLHHHRHL